MKSETLVTTLTSLTTAMAVAAPFVVFGFLYVMRVQPERAAADRLRAELTAVREQVDHRRSGVTPSGAIVEARARDEFPRRTPEADGASKLRNALAALLNGPDVIGVSHLSIQTGTAADDPTSPLAGPFGSPVVQTPVRVTFDARYEQIARFFRDLGAVPTAFDLQSVEVVPPAPATSGVMRAKVTLLAFERPTATETPEPAARPRVEVTTRPEPGRDPVLTGILFSSGRRVALVDGVMVRPGDPVGSGVVLSIEPDAVTIAEPGGPPRQIGITRAQIPALKR